VGGPYLDIINRGKYGLSYKTSEELAEEIDSTYDDEKEWRRLNSLSIRRCIDFDASIFESKVKNLVSKLLGG
jgi:hypothetical protein